jgi:hypothetical protein
VKRNANHEPTRRAFETASAGPLGGAADAGEEQEAQLSTKVETMDEREQPGGELTDEQLEKVPGGTFVKSWSTSGDADDRPTEEVAFYYNRIAFSYTPTTDGKK